RASQPVILQGAIADWPAMKKWSLEYFKDQFGDRDLPVVRDRNGSYYDARGGLNYERIRFADYCDLIANGAGHDAFMTVRVHETLPELFSDVRELAYAATAPWVRSRFWMGGPGYK